MYKIPANTEFLGKTIHYLPSCHSTNDIAIGLLEKDGVPTGTVVITDDQTGGKGQLGNSWESQKDLNLTFTLIIYPENFHAKNQFDLTKITTLGMTDYFRKFLNIDVEIKWPNDLIYRNSKLAGILINNSIQKGHITDTIIGLGINVNQTEFKTDGAASLKSITGREYLLQTIFESVLHAIEKRYLSYLEGAGAKLTTEYLTRLYGINRKLIFKEKDNAQRFEGIIRGVNDAGLLEVEVEGKRRIYGFREIVFLRQ